jgi:5-methylcytosine-specific restriction endonuclease McrA
MVIIAISKGLTKIYPQPIIKEDKTTEKIMVVRNTITEAERDAIFDRDGRKCLRCGTSEYLQIDHIVPFSKGGTTSRENLQTLCKSCNCRKGNRN